MNLVNLMLFHAGAKVVKFVSDSASKKLANWGYNRLSTGVSYFGKTASLLTMFANNVKNNGLGHGLAETVVAGLAGGVAKNTVDFTVSEALSLNG